VHQVGFIYKDFSCLAATYAYGSPVLKPTVRQLRVFGFVSVKTQLFLVFFYYQLV